MALRLVPTPLPDPNPRDSLGERIVSARGYRRMTQAEVIENMQEAAERLGVKAPVVRTLQAWEKDATSPTVKQLGLLAEAVGATSEWFVRNIDLTDGPDDDGGHIIGESSSACTIPGGNVRPLRPIVVHPTLVAA